MDNAIRLSLAMKILGCTAPTLRRLIKQGRLKAEGNGPARRILLSSIEESGLPRQQELLTADMTREPDWTIAVSSNDCRWRNGEGICGHRTSIICSRDFGKAIYCTSEKCPVGVMQPCKLKVSK